MATLDSRWRFYSAILIVQAFYSLHAWFLWGLSERMVSIVMFLLAGWFLFTSPFWDFKNSKKLLAAVLLILIYIYRTIINEGNFNYYLFEIMSSFTIIPIILLKSKYQLDLLNKFQNTLSIVLLVSLVFWVGHLLGIDLPSTSLTFGTIERVGGIDDQYTFANHYLYLVNQGSLFNDSGFLPSFMRFSSVFLEPGYLSIIIVFLLFINGFDLRDKRNIIYLLTIIATVSLAGYLMIIIAYIAHVLQKSRNRWLSLVGFFLLIIISSAFFKEYNGGNNFINKGIIERLEYDQVTGNIAGYNRTTENFDYAFDRFWGSANIVTGYGEERQKAIDSGGVGYKIYLMQYGLIGLFLFILYLVLIAKVGNNYRSYILLLLYIIMFARGHGTMFYSAFMLTYICGVAQTVINKDNNEENCTRSPLQPV